MTLGQRIQELRKGAGLSQEALGETLGVSRQAVSKWESDGGIPELDTLIAMSRLFGVTLGQLLGVEDAAPPSGGTDPAAPSFTEAQVEDILRRYAEENRLPRAGVKKWAWLPLAGILLAAVLAVLFSRINALNGTVRQLQNSMANLENRVSENLSSLNSSLRGTILDVLEEENCPISAFQYEMTSFSLADKTVTLGLNASLRSYTRGETEVQFLLAWDADGKTGQALGRWVSGPDWTDTLTIPMNGGTNVTVRIRENGGLTQEYKIADPIYGLEEDSFALSAYNLHAPFAVTIRGRGFTSQTSRAEYAYIDIWSGYPEYVRPVTAELAAWVNGEEILSEPLRITEDDEPGLFRGSLEAIYHEVELKEGDRFEVRLTVTDSLGRIQAFEEEGSVSDGRLDMMVPTAPAVSVG